LTKTATDRVQQCDPPIKEMMMTTIPNTTNGTATTVNPSTAPVLDLKQFALPQNFGDVLGVQKALLRLPVRKPDRHWFVRVHPDPAYQLATSLLELRDEREYYLVSPAALPGCASEAVPTLLYLAITRLGSLFIWPVRLPGTDGRDNIWHASARDAAARAQTTWVSVRSNPDLGGYEVIEAVAEYAPPEWPKKPMSELLALGFRGRIITTPDHEVLLKLQGFR
jgi:hypothetical protein